jgi:hypothetical protein
VQRVEEELGLTEGIGTEPAGVVAAHAE